MTNSHISHDVNIILTQTTTKKVMSERQKYIYLVIDNGYFLSVRLTEGELKSRDCPFALLEVWSPDSVGEQSCWEGCHSLTEAKHGWCQSLVGLGSGPKIGWVKDTCVCVPVHTCLQ